MTKARHLLEKTRTAQRDAKRPGERCAADPGAWIPRVDRGRCEGKGDCNDVCPHDVFGVRTIEAGDFQRLPLLSKLKSIAHGKRTAYVDAPDRCRACGLCVVACPERAIRLMRTAPLDSSEPAP